MSKRCLSMALALLLCSLAAAQASASQVTVYTSNPNDLVDFVTEAFRQEYGIEVLVVRAGQGELLQRIVAERARPQADVFWGGSKEALDAHREYFDPYVPEAAAHTPPEFRDPDGYWIGNIIHVHVIMANRQLLGSTPAPRRWADLLDPAWKNQVVYADPAASGSAYTQLTLLLSVFGRDGQPGWDRVEQLINNARILGGSSLIYRGVGDGEYPLGITMEYAAYRYVDGGAPIELIYPEDGTVAQPEGSAIIKGAPNLENARLFQEFVNRKDIREEVLRRFYRRPARADISVSQVAPGLPDLEDITFADYDSDWAAANRRQILQRAQDIIMMKR